MTQKANARGINKTISVDQIFGEGSFVEEMVVSLSTSVKSDSKRLAWCPRALHGAWSVAALNSQLSDAWMRLSLRSLGL